MERNESLLAAARRECAEECGISLLSTTSAIYGQRYQVGKKTKATLYFAARTATSTVTLSEEHDQAVWLQAAEVLGHLHHSSLQALFAQHCQDLSLDFGLDHGLERPTRDGDAA
jgi:8-oxo-dGTP pyrophosphatase MutT (NUDIX family)